MRKVVVVLLVLFLSSIVVESHGHDMDWSMSTRDEENWRDSLGLGKEKLSRLHFYFHDTISGKKPSALKIAQAPNSFKSPTLFGVVMMADDPLTQGPEPTSKVVGQAQGLYGSADQHTLGLLMAMCFVFTDGVYNGSTLSILGRNAALESPREMPVVGGTGVFRLARGVVFAKTYWVNITSGDAIVEYNVTAIHY